MMDEFDQIINEYEQTLQQSPVQDSSFSMCCNQDTVIIGSNRTCQVCGKSTEEFIFVIQTESIRFRKRSVYKRIDYFVHLLKLITCQKVCVCPGYDAVLETLWREKFNNILELKAVMKAHKFNHYYPFIYLLFQDIKNECLINLSQKQFQSFVYIFRKAEWLFKTRAKDNNRHNFYSYSSFIYCLLVDHKIKGSEHVILPVSTNQLLPKIQKLLSLLQVKQR